MDIRDNDSGLMHLTPNGWMRKDKPPWPAGRVESWAFEAERPSTDAKQHVRLTRTWTAPGAPALHARFGEEPIAPREDRHISIDCKA
ncbi:MAG TPA: hypothetical protein VMH86_06945 [Rhizomicrobium sp.]|nr:hypothetical protein [Rhizomicrobium sp.]